MDDQHLKASHAPITKAKLLMPRWIIHRLQNSLGEHAPAWDALNQCIFNSHPMLDSRFVNGLLRHFGDGSECLCILTANGVQQTMALLRPRGLGVWITFLPMQTQICPVLTKSADDLSDLMPCLPGFAFRLDLLCIDPAFIALPDAGNGTAQVTNHALTMAISLQGGFAHYRNTRSKKLIQNIGRYERRLAADQHTQKFVQIDSPQDIRPAVARYAALESQGWKAELGTALNMSDKQGAFYTDLLNRFAADGEAKVFELWFDDSLVASRLAIFSGRMIVMLKTTYSENFSQYSPGRLLLHAVIESLFASHPGHVIEFYTNANADQLAWAKDQRWIKHVSLYRNALARRAFDSARKVVANLKSSAHAMPPAQQPLTVIAYRHPDEFPPDVLIFFDEAAANNVECSAYWYRNLVNGVFATHDGVYFYVLLDQSKPVAAIPVLVKKATMGNTIEALGNYYTTLYAPMLAAHANAQHTAQLIRAMKTAHAPVTSFRFALMDPQAQSYNNLKEALRLTGFLPFQFFCTGNWYLPVKDTWSVYLGAREGILRSTIKRMSKRFAAAGGTTELIFESNDIDRGLASYQKVYASSWKTPEPYPEFIPGLLRACASRGWLRLGIAYIKSEPVAAQIWIVANAKASIYKLAYDEGFSTYAPGTLLTAMLMEHALDKDKVTEVDYLNGDDKYKRSWMSHRRERWGIIAYNPKTINGTIGLLKEVFSRALKQVIQSNTPAGKGSTK